MDWICSWILIEASGNAYDSDICIIHDKIKPVSDRNLKIYKSRKKNKHLVREIYITMERIIL